MLTKNKNWLTNKRTSCILISNKEFPAYRKVVEMSKKISTKSIILIGMFAAVLAVMAQISIPMPSGVPITLQTFGVALTGTILGHKLGTGAVFTYLAIGGVGMPVFSNMSGGFASFVGKTGGFLIGFLFMVWFCGFGVQWEDKKLCLLYNTLGLVICHWWNSSIFFFDGNVILGVCFTCFSALFHKRWIIGYCRHSSGKPSAKKACQCRAFGEKGYFGK